MGEEEPVPELEGVELLGQDAAEGGAHHRVRARRQLEQAGHEQVDVAGVVVLEGKLRKG